MNSTTRKLLATRLKRPGLRTGSGLKNTGIYTVLGMLGASYLFPDLDDQARAELVSRAIELVSAVVTMEPGELLAYLRDLVATAILGGAILDRKRE